MALLRSSVTPRIFVGDVFPEHFVLDRTRGSQIGQYGFFGQFEGCFRFGHVVDDLIECVDGLGHFVVLRGDDRCEKIIVVQVARIDPLREGHVSQAAGFAHLLEDDGSHAAAVVFVVQFQSGIDRYVDFLPRFEYWRK